MPAPYRDINVSRLNGLWDRGQDDTIPKDHFIDCLNVTWDGDDITTRDGSAVDISTSGNIGNIVRVHEYKITGQASRLLVLNTSGQLYDATASTSSPILTISGMEDFSICVFFDRAYISPHNRVEGKAGTKVYVYNGAGTARVAAGAKPAAGGSAFTATEGSSGNVEIGVHYFAVIYETDTGYYTVPGPTTFAKVTCTGTKQVDLTNVPTGPSHITKRHIIVTKAIASASDTGNQDGYSYYFVPSGTIANNSGTTITLDFYDSSLVEGADYLFNQLEEIPAAVNLVSFSGRMVTMGEDGGENYIRISKVNEPESFNSVSGFIQIAPEESDSIRTAFEFRETLYLCKSNRLYATSDNGGDPGTWTWISIDKGAGTGAFGVGTVLDTQGTNLDYVLIATKQGLSLFNGIFAERELTYKIESLWKRVNPTHFDKVQVVVDSINKKIYLAVPLDSATSISHVLVGDYSRQLEPFKIRWAVWTFPSNMDPTSILVKFDSNNYPVLHWGSADNNVYRISSSATNDSSTAIPTPAVQTALLRLKEGNETCHFESLSTRVKGTGNLDITAIGYDASALGTLSSITLASSPGSAKAIHIGLDSEVLSIRMQTDSINESFTLTYMTVQANLKWGPSIS